MLSQSAREMLDFWKNEIQNYKSLLDLPLDFLRPPVARSLGKAHFFQLPPQAARILHEYCDQNKIAPFIALLTCYLIVLARYSNQKKIVIGVPLTNRRHSGDNDTLGCFVNILPLALELHKDLTVLEAMRLVRQKLLRAHRNQEIAFHDIVAAVQPPREAGYNPIFQVGFTYEPPMELQLTGLRVISEKWHNQGAQLDLFLNIFEISPGVQGYFEYNIDLFAPDTISRISNQYQRFVGSLHQHAVTHLSRVELLSQEEKDKLLIQWNDTATYYGEAETLDTLFEKQVARTPDKIAVVFNESQLTYQELNERANQLAHYLIDQGIGPEDMIVVFMERSLEMVIAIYAILKAGGAYVPLEPDTPLQRLSLILNETKAKIVLTQKHLEEKLSPSGCASLNLDFDWSAIEGYPIDNPIKGALPCNLAYIMYTSGSTGLPKGVMNEHRGIFNRLMWMQETFKLQPQDKVLQKTPFSFDVSVWEFFWPLITGASLIVAPPQLHKSPTKLSRFIQKHAITTIHFVPSMLSLFLEVDESSGCKSLQQVFCSGETLKWELQETFFKKFACRLHNLYGPTEAAIDVSHWECKPQTAYRKVPIGYPIANTQLYILDEHLKPVPQGAIGELYIGGVQVARGYLQREQLNEAAFIADPFDVCAKGHLYKTGDLARYLPDGAIDYLGRVDSQIKLFGNRIELLEIEECLCRDPQINEAVVTLFDAQTEKPQLVAFLTRHGNTNPNELELRQHLAKLIPYYMIPNQFVFLEKIPLTESGKVDRKLLQYPHQEKKIPSVDAIKAGEDHVLLVATIWKKILDIDEIDVQCNFFDAGGNSLLATQLALDVEKELGVHIPLVKFFQYPTVLTFAGYLKEYCI
jgi:microcystin synthetase protein McyC